MILGKPQNLEDFYEADLEKSKFLHELGFIPVYRFENSLYFIKTETLKKVVEKWENQK